MSPNQQGQLSTEQRKCVDEIFAEAMVRPRDEREAFIKEASNGDRNVERELLTLLRNVPTETDRGFLASAALLPPSVASCSPDESSTASIDHSVIVWNETFHDMREDLRPLPSKVSKYRIIEKIGESGQGVVFRAVQAETEQVVALKVIKPGQMSDEAVERFRFEARFLGRLNHPGVAHIKEAGTFDEGQGPQPFFVMEFVEGEPIDEFVRLKNLSIRDRFALLAKVCDAVQAAHNRGIIHRDLKPANILVTEDPAGSSAGQPKVLDFGIAFAVESEEEREALRGRAGQIIGTFPYMSPEQISGDIDNVDHQSDVYSLGVIAYRLVTGAMPYEPDTRTREGWRKCIMQMPPTPFEAHSLRLERDPDAIVMKALEKSKEARFGSPAQMSEEIRRYLDLYPTSIRRPSSAERFIKFTRRNKALVGGMAATFVVLLAGFVVSSLLYVRAEHQRVLAELNEAHANDNATSLERFTSLVLENVVGDIELERTPHEIADGFARLVDADDLRTPVVRAAMLWRLGQLELRVGRYQDAAPRLEAAAELMLSDQAYSPREAALATIDLVDALFRLEQADDALDKAHEAYALLKNLPEDHAPEIIDAKELVPGAIKRLGDLDTALDMYNEVLESRTTVGQSDLEIAGTKYNIALVLDEKAQLLLHRGQSGAADEAGDDHAQLVSYANELTEEAVRLMQHAADVRTAHLGTEHARTINAMGELARLQRRLGNHEEAEFLYRTTISASRNALGGAHWRTLMSEFNLATLLIMTDRVDEGLDLMLQTHQLFLRVEGIDSGRTIGSGLRAIRSLISHDQHEQAIEVANTILAEAANYGLMDGRHSAALAQIQTVLKELLPTDAIP